MTTGVGVMSAALTFAGVLQTHLERVMGQDYMDVQQQLGCSTGSAFAAAA